MWISKEELKKMTTIRIRKSVNFAPRSSPYIDIPIKEALLAIMEELGIELKWNNEPRKEEKKLLVLKKYNENLRFDTAI